MDSLESILLVCAMFLLKGQVLVMYSYLSFIPSHFCIIELGDWMGFTKEI